MGARYCCCCKSEPISPMPEDEPSRVETPPKSPRIETPPKSPSIETPPEPPRIETPSEPREYSAMDRFNKIDIKTTNPLTLINGYLDEPLLLLEEALKPLDDEIDQLSHYIIEAKAQCYYPSEHNLTLDESAAIYIYTMNWGEGCLYDHLQAAWSSEDPSKLKPWFKYLKLFKTALDKLPTEKTEIWQGTSFDEGLKEKLSSKSLSFYSSLSSCSPSADVINDHLQNNIGTKSILVGYEAVNGKSVTGYTANNSKEVIVWPGMKLGVAKYIEADSDGSLIVHLVGQVGKYHCS